jgi:hypothetical protein
LIFIQLAIWPADTGASVTGIGEVMSFFQWDPVKFDVGAPKAPLEGLFGRLNPGFFAFLSLWLRSHICHLDTKYGRLAGMKRAV